jgi:hypothetical protein
MFNFFTAVVAASAAATVGAIPTRRSQTASITPHDKYSSSIGVLGCKIDTNNVAYWPSSVDCDKICVKVSRGGRSRHLLKIDQSGGAYDISYDAWNYLAFGKSATEDPRMGGGLEMEYEFVDNEECADLLDDGKLALSASNSISFVTSCGADTWVGKNHKLINIQDSQCKYGEDVECKLDLAVSNQPDCGSSVLGINSQPDLEVLNIAYGTGDEVTAQ